MAVEDLGHHCNGSLIIKHLMLGSNAKIISNITFKRIHTQVSKGTNHKFETKNVFLPRFEAK